MRLITWNINSVRLRLPIVLRLLEQKQPDILCLQETKCPDEHFPHEAFQAAGYEHIHIHGMKSYNGLAILSKIPFEASDIYHRVGRQDCRHIAVTLPDGTELHNLYIPAGGDEPDPEVNDKFAHKLNFVDEMTRWFADQYTPDQKVIAVGDFNIAPGEHDVWSHKQLLGVVSHTPPETERLAKMKGSLDWVDVSRHFVPEDEKCYTWWSYRNKDWEKSNRGRRLDHVWVSPPLAEALRGHEILTAARNWEKPSDHVPLIVDFKL
ncbi:MAG: exodeoxyribonuclease III [Alphaproteobacteria bacterium]|nr:exodeoxyribonuclease III [Alphaproteobacteria bacterium]